MAFQVEEMAWFVHSLMVSLVEEVGCFEYSYLASLVEEVACFDHSFPWSYPEDCKIRNIITYNYIYYIINNKMLKCEKKSLS